MVNDYLNELECKLEKEKLNDNEKKLCIEYAERLINNNLPVIFDKVHFSLLLGIDIENLNKFIFLDKSFYKTISIPKKSGGFRNINSPSENLKIIQKWILTNILEKISISDKANGFIRKKSIVTNAIRHINKECIINLDVKNFFPTITYEDVFNIFYYYGYTKEMSFLLSKLCTLNSILPQGAPTSPYISNIVCKKLDKRLNSLCVKINADYSRYADDITISGSRKIRDYLDLIKKILKEEGFENNRKKERIIDNGNRKMVTGLIVNQKLSVPKKKKRYLRQQIYYCNKFGVTNHLEKINQLEKSNYMEHLFGLAYFIKMVEKEEGEKYLKELNDLFFKK